VGIPLDVGCLKAGVQLSVVREKLNMVADGGRRKLSVVTMQPEPGGSAALQPIGAGPDSRFLSTAILAYTSRILSRAREPTIAILGHQDKRLVIEALYPTGRCTEAIFRCGVSLLLSPTYSGTSTAFLRGWLSYE